MEDRSPRYMEVCRALRADIESGKYPVGSLLPTESELQQLYHVSRTTVRSAIAVLREDRYLAVRQGRGTEVLPRAADRGPFRFSHVGERVHVFHRFVHGKADQVGLVGAGVDTVEADSTAAAALRVLVGTPLYRLQRVKYSESIPFAYVVSYVPCHLAPGLERYDGQIMMLYSFLAEHYGISYASCTIDVEAVGAGFISARMLDVPPETALLRELRTTRDTEGRYFEYNVSDFRSDCFKLAMELDSTPDPASHPEQETGPRP